MGAEASSERGCCVGNHRDKGCCVRQDKTPQGSQGPGSPVDGDLEPMTPHRILLAQQNWFVQEFRNEPSPPSTERTLHHASSDLGGVNTPRKRTMKRSSTEQQIREMPKSGDSSMRAEDTDPCSPRSGESQAGGSVPPMNFNTYLMNMALMKNKTEEPLSSRGWTNAGEFEAKKELASARSVGASDTREFEANKAFRDWRRAFTTGGSAESLDTDDKDRTLPRTAKEGQSDTKEGQSDTKEGQSDTKDFEAFRDLRRLFQSASTGNIASNSKGTSPRTARSDASETTKAFSDWRRLFTASSAESSDTCGQASDLDTQSSSPQALQATKESPSNVSESCSKDTTSTADTGATEVSNEFVVKPSADLWQAPLSHRKHSSSMTRLDLEFLTTSQEFERLNEELGDTVRVCILGGIVMQEPNTPALIKDIAEGLDSILGPDVVFLTGGMPGVQKEFAKNCGDGSRLWNLMPAGHDSRYGTGKDIDAGIGLQNSKDLYGQIGDVYLVVEGGPGVSSEAKAVAQRNGMLVPVARSGGAASGMFEFPAAALERPWWASEEHWSLLNRTDVPVAKTASAVSSIVRLAVALRRGSEESPRSFLDNPAGHGCGRKVPERGRRQFAVLRSGSDLVHKQAADADDEEVGSWIEELTGEARDGQPLHIWLRSGQVLYKLANEMQPGIIPKEAHQIGTGNCFAQMDLLAAFARACRQLGVPEKDIFSSAAFYEGRDLETFRRCMLTLARTRS